MRTMLLALLLSLVTAAVAPSGASGQGGFGFEEVSFTVSVGSLDLDVGEQRSVDLRLTDLSGPVGAWTIDITYDPGVVSITDCIVLTNSICDTSRSADTLRVTGASATGLAADTTLATIGFRCEREGRSSLSVSAESGAIPELVYEIDTRDGSISCQEPALATATSAPLATPTFSLPETGTGLGLEHRGVSSTLWGLVGIGLAAIAAASALYVRVTRRQ